MESCCNVVSGAVTQMQAQELLGTNPTGQGLERSHLVAFTGPDLSLSNCLGLLGYRMKEDNHKCVLRLSNSSGLHCKLIKKPSDL